MRCKFSHIICIIILCLGSSCDKGFEELNKDPLNPTTAQVGPIFNSIVESLKLGWNRQLFLHNEKLYDITELAVVTAETFGNVEQGAEDVWENYYGALQSFRELERRFDDPDIDSEQFEVIRSQLKILMAYKGFQITDLFGDIPYFEAGRAYDQDPILRPVFDDHEVIYKTLIDDLLTSVSFLQAIPDETISGLAFQRLGPFDTMFGDDSFSWVKFGNSLLLRYLIRIYDTQADYVAPIIEQMIFNGASFIGEGEDVLMSPRDQDWNNQGVNWSFREHNKLRMGSTMWSYMTQEDEILDPRARIYFETNNDDEWAAFPQVQNANTLQSGGSPYSNVRDGNYANKGSGNIYSSFNYYLIRDEKDIPEIIMTSAELKFLLAELFLKGIGVPADQNNAWFNYQLGMWESLKFWQGLTETSEIWLQKPELLSSGELFTVVELPKYNFNNANSIEGKLKLIYTQRWIDNFRQPWEAFSLVRQTQLIPREKQANDFFRFKYPPSEAINNSDNYNLQVAKMGGDLNSIKAWWMN